ncbi:MAG: phospholipase [Pseudomonadota bacterium]
MMPSDTPTGPVPITQFESLFTAEEAFAAFERAILAARSTVVAGFRVFDLSTPLTSPEARAVGTDWFDLILYKLNQGVAFDMTLTDFDPTVATDDHRGSWRSARQFASVHEMSDGAPLRFEIALHPARVGLLPRLLFSPKVRKARTDAGGDALTPGLNARKARDDLSLAPTTHHQKLAVIDDEVLYIGGLDLNARRYDTKRHDRPAEQTWHDIHALVRGPVVEAAARHLATFKDVVAASCAPVRPMPGFLRTLSARRRVPLVHIAPATVVAEIEETHLRAIARCKGAIYLETQFLRHLPIAQAVVDRAKLCETLTCLVVLPAAPEDVAFAGNRDHDAKLGAQKQMEAVDLLSEGMGARLAVASPAQRRPALPSEMSDRTVLHGAPIIYVHSKLSLFAGQEGVLSSANLNGRSLRWDTEAGLHLTQPAHLAQLWTRALGHWFPGLTWPDPHDDPLAFIGWVRTALAQNQAAAPQDRAHFLLPFPRQWDADLATPLPVVPDEIV